MPATSILNESVIRNLATPQSFARGQEYFHSGAVHHIERRGNTLLAEVAGSHYKPYQVTVELDAGSVVDVTCTCEYDRDGACKHIVAVLLAYSEQSHQIEQLPSVDTLLGGLERETLYNLLRSLLEQHPTLVSWVEGQLALRNHSGSSAQTPPTPHQRATTIDTGALRRQIRQVKRAFNHDDFYRVGDSGLINTLSELLGKAYLFIEGEDAAIGLDILTVLAEETTDDWHEYDHDGDTFDQFFEELGGALAEAILTIGLSPEKRNEWAERITEWQSGLDEYGVEVESFDVAIGAAMQGWDSEPLLRAMQGEITERGAWAGEAPWYADALTTIRLTILERQGRVNEYLNLAKAEGQITPYLTMLVKLNRVQEAVDHGLKYLATADDALLLAQTLREKMRFVEALQIAEYGLSLHGTKGALASWLRDFAIAQGKLELALQAARVAFAESLMLADYQAIQPLVGDNWLVIKQELLEQLKIKQYAYERIDIYLYENMIDEAVKIVDEQLYAGYGTVEKVVDAALTTHPDWVIRQCRLQAEPIMDSGKSNAYHHALRWLAKAGHAFQAAGRQQEWQSYLQSLLDKHHRKYALVPGLKELLATTRQKKERL